jgi:hypothetical protein
METPKQSQSKVKDPLEAEINNRQAIYSIMELYDVDEKTAEELWSRFIETVMKMKDIVKNTE